MTTDNQQLVHTRTLDWREMVQRSWGKDWTKPEPAYEFGSRTLDDPKDGGPYDQD
jgi:hypothetical protein